MWVCVYFYISVCVLSVSLLIFLWLCSFVCMCVCVCVCVCVWRKAWKRGGQSFTMVNWKEPFFYSAINPIWVNNTLLCSWAVTVICWALNPRALQTPAGHPNDDKMLQKTAFQKVYNAKYCVSLYNFRKAGDTLEREGTREKRRDSKEEG